MLLQPNEQEAKLSLV